MNDRGRKKKKGRDYAFAKDDRSRCTYTLWNYSLGKKKKKLPLLILYEIYSIFIKVLLQICDLVSEILG